MFILLYSPIQNNFTEQSLNPAQHTLRLMSTVLYLVMKASRKENNG